MGDLLPCPFCGVRPLVCEWEPAFQYTTVTCNHDDCAAEISVTEKTEAEAIAAWNRRAIPAADARTEALAVPEVAELIEAYSDIIDYGPLVFAKKDQWARLAAAKAAVEGAKPSETS